MQSVSGMITADNSTLEINSSGQMRVKDLGITTAKLAALAVTAAKVDTQLGTPVAKTIGTIYQAATDGYVVAFMQIDNGDDVRLHSDAATPPTTAVQKLYTGSGTTAFDGSMCFPVKKNEYYKLTLVAGTVTPAAYYFIPSGG